MSIIAGKMGRVDGGKIIQGSSIVGKVKYYGFLDGNNQGYMLNSGVATKRIIKECTADILIEGK